MVIAVLYTSIDVLVLGIGITRGQYYWVLDIGCLSWYRSNHNYICTSSITHWKAESWENVQQRKNETAADE